MSIRRYGPGKFYTILDSYAYGITLDGGADYEVGYEEGGGWYGFLTIDSAAAERISEEASEQGDQLTREEEKVLYDSAAVIFFERSDGIVESDWYDDLQTAEEAWSEIEAEVEGDDDDAFTDDQMHEGYVIQDARGEGYEVAHEGRVIAHYESMDDALDAIRTRMDLEKFWPNIYYVNERGNVDLLDADGNIIESRV